MSAENRSRRSVRTANGHEQHSSQFKVRCQCETQNEDGEMIECEQCKDWQHTYCMGIVNIRNTKDYRCEMCDPRLLMVPKSEAIRFQTLLKPAETPKDNSKTSKNDDAPLKQKQRRRSYFVDPELFLNHIAEKSRTIDRPVVVNKFFDEYKRAVGYEGPASLLIQKCRVLLRSETHIMSQFRKDTRAKMHFITSTPVKPAFLKDLQKSAQVKLDAGDRITSYKSASGVEFSGKPTRRSGNIGKRKAGGRGSTKRKRRGYNSDDDEEEEEEDDSIVQLEEIEEYQERNRRPRGREPQQEPEDDDDLEVIFDKNVTPVVKAERAYSIADSYGNSTEMIQNTFTDNSNFAPGPSNRPNYIFQQMMMMENHALNGMNNLVQSITGLIDSQTLLMRELTQQRTPAPPPSPPPFAPPEEQVDVRHFLEYLRMYMQSIESPQLATIKQELMTKTKEIGIEFKKIPMSRVQLALESAVALADSSTESYTFELTSASEFFRIMHVYARGQRGTQLQGFCEMIKRKLSSMDDREKIHVEKIKVAMEAAVGIALMD